MADDDTSGYESMKPSSDGQTVASGDTEGNTTENVLTQMLNKLFFLCISIYMCAHMYTCICIFFTCMFLRNRGL